MGEDIEPLFGKFKTIGKKKKFKYCLNPQAIPLNLAYGPSFGK
jgi:hypothetical protein